MAAALERGSDGGTQPGASVAALECATFVLAEAAPYAVVLARFEGPGKALFAHVTASADLFRLLDLKSRRAGIADREEQLRVLIETRGAASPVHDGNDPFLRRCQCAINSARVKPFTSARYKSRKSIRFAQPLSGVTCITGG